MYTIIGGDGKEYGPVSADDLRQWLAEGRLNAQTLAKGEGDAEFRPLSVFPELADSFAAQTPAGGMSAAVPAPADWETRDYELDIGGCISRGWNLFKENFGVLFVSCLIMFAVQIGFVGALNLIITPFAKGLLHAPVVFLVGFKYLLPLVTSLVIGPMAGGVNFVYLKTIRRQGAGVGEVFAGFQRAFAQLYLGALAVGLIAGACLLPFQLVWQAKAGPLLEQLQQTQAQHTSPADMQNVLHDLLHAFAGAVPVLLICLIPMTYLVVCWQFTLPLIIDQELKFWPAMKTSFKMVNKHWWQVFGLTIVVGLVSGVGALACCVGVLFTAPIGIAAMMFAYETIFCARPAR
jgi:uncharacterized membrane protein